MKKISRALAKRWTEFTSSPLHPGSDSQSETEVSARNKRPQRRVSNASLGTIANKQFFPFPPRRAEKGCMISTRRSGPLPVRLPGEMVNCLQKKLQLLKTLQLRPGQSPFPGGPSCNGGATAAPALTAKQWEPGLALTRGDWRLD